MSTVSITRETTEYWKMIRRAPLPSLLLLVLLQVLARIKTVYSLAPPSPSLSTNNGEKIAVIAGATGYIGKATVRESVQQGYQTFALVRDLSKVDADSDLQECFQGAKVVECDVCNASQLNQVLSKGWTSGKSIGFLKNLTYLPTAFYKRL